MNSATAPTRYDSWTLALHWLSAAIVAAVWLLGQTIDRFARGDPRTAARSVHILLGVVLAIVLLARVWHRYHVGVHLPPAGLGWPDRLAAWTHTLLYALLIGTVIVGLANAWVRGDTLIGLFTIPAFDPGNKALRSTVQEIHSYFANTLLIVALLHAAAGLLHHYVLKDDVLRRMLPLRVRR